MTQNNTFCIIPLKESSKTGKINLQRQQSEVITFWKEDEEGKGESAGVLKMLYVSTCMVVVIYGYVYVEIHQTIHLRFVHYAHTCTIYTDINNTSIKKTVPLNPGAEFLFQYQFY